jgi:hypothetical protein
MKKVILLIVLISIFVSCDANEIKHTNVPPTPNLRVEEALKYCRENNMNTDFCILVDMGTHSGVERLVVWDFKNDSIIKAGLVSHGCGVRSWGSDDTKESPVFSNLNNSHLSSIGKYAIGSRAWSNWGINIKYWLKGLEPTNNNAVNRVIVLHGWDAVSDNVVFPQGTPEGWGCPAVSNNMMKFLDSKLRYESKKTLFWIYK